MSNKIYEIRQVELDPSLAAKLFPFVNAWRPHDPIPTWRDLKAQGLEKIDEDSLMDVIQDQFEAERECVTDCEATL
jgi:hypothetical protein